MTYNVLCSETLLYMEEQKEAVEDIARFTVLPWDSQDFAEALPEAHVLMVDCRTVDAEVMSKAKNLLLVIQYGVGVDTIDIDHASSQGILVCNVPDAYTREVAEHSMALIMALSREIVQAAREVSGGIWDPHNFMPIRMKGKTLGVIGFGRIGQTVAEMAKVLGFKVLVNSRSAREGFIEETGAVPASMEELLRESDIVSIHTSLTSKTRYLLGPAEFQQMKDGVLLVNTARGEVLQEDALLDALKSGKVKAAALDVLSQEPPPPDHPLLGLDNVVVTPHLAWRSPEGDLNVEMDAIRQVRAALVSERPQHLVNPDIWDDSRLKKRAGW